MKNYEISAVINDVTIFEKDQALGGQLRFAIPKHRLPTAILNREGTVDSIII